MVKLDRINYFAWKAQVTTHLCSNNLLRFIEIEVNDNDEMMMQ